MKEIEFGMYYDKFNNEKCISQLNGSNILKCLMKYKEDSVMGTSFTHIMGEHLGIKISLNKNIEKCIIRHCDIEKVFDTELVKYKDLKELAEGVKSGSRYSIDVEINKEVYVLKK